MSTPTIPLATIAVTPTSVTLAAGGVPATLTVTTSTDTAVATYTIIVTGSGGGQTHPVSVTLTVEPVVPMAPAGRYTVFTIARYTEGFDQGDIALYDRQSNTLVATPGLNDPDANVDDIEPSISQNGRYIALASNRNEGSYDVHLYDRNTSSLVDLPGSSSEYSDGSASVSGDGRHILFEPWRAFGEDGGEVLLYDRSAGALVPLPGLGGQGSKQEPAISSDGRTSPSGPTGPSMGLRNREAVRGSRGRVPTTSTSMTGRRPVLCRCRI